MKPITKILVPTDFGAAAEEATAYACQLARATGAALHLVHVVDDVTIRLAEFLVADIADVQASILEAGVARLRRRVEQPDLAPLAPRTTVLTSSTPADAIVSLAAEDAADLVVMGTHGRTPMARALLGSVADRVVRRGPCPVLVVRAAGHLWQEGVPESAEWPVPLGA